MKNISNKKSEAINEIITDYLLTKFESEALLPIVEKKLHLAKADTKFQDKISNSLLIKTIEFYSDQKAQIEKGIYAIENNIEFYKAKLNK